MRMYTLSKDVPNFNTGEVNKIYDSCRFISLMCLTGWTRNRYYSFTKLSVDIR
jgi:hypothetical protein